MYEDEKNKQKKRKGTCKSLFYNNILFYFLKKCLL